MESRGIRMDCRTKAAPPHVVAPNATPKMIDTNDNHRPDFQFIKPANPLTKSKNVVLIATIIVPITNLFLVNNSSGFQKYNPNAKMYKIPNEIVIAMQNP
jgi:hypothetical protein